VHDPGREPFDHLDAGRSDPHDDLCPIEKAARVPELRSCLRVLVVRPPGAEPQPRLDPHLVPTSHEASHSRGCESDAEFARFHFSRCGDLHQIVLSRVRGTAPLPRNVPDARRWTVTCDGSARIET